jgi:hypothetical protein
MELKLKYDQLQKEATDLLRENNVGEYQINEVVSLSI